MQVAIALSGVTVLLQCGNHYQGTVLYCILYPRIERRVSVSGLGAGCDW